MGGSALADTFSGGASCASALPAASRAAAAAAASSTSASAAFPAAAPLPVRAHGGGGLGAAAPAAAVHRWRSSRRAARREPPPPTPPATAHPPKADGPPPLSPLPSRPSACRPTRGVQLPPAIEAAIWRDRAAFDATSGRGDSSQPWVRRDPPEACSDHPLQTLGVQSPARTAPDRPFSSASPRSSPTRWWRRPRASCSPLRTRPSRRCARRSASGRGRSAY